MPRVCTTPSKLLAHLPTTSTSSPLYSFEAVRAAGAFMATDIVTASTRPAANQMFVDGFMTGRVSSSSQGSGM